MGSQQLYSLSWGEFGTSLTSTVQVLRGHGEMVDVTLAAGGRIFPAHKLVLSAASPLLMELLKSTHCHHPVVMLAGITAPDMEALLQFVYQGEVSVDPSQLPSLLQAAHCLDIQALSPQTLSTEKTMAQISVPVVMNDNHLRDMNSTLQPIPSPLLPVRKRKRKQRRNSETEGIKWAAVEEVGGVVEPQPLEQVVDNSHNSHHPLVHNPTEDQMKDEIMDEQHCNGETSGVGQVGGKKLVSDLPVECTICGVTLRQSRNLRRHMELIHLKVENNGKPRKSQVKDETKKEDETVQNAQSVQSVQTLTEVVDLDVEQSAGPSRLPPPPPLPPPSAPHILTSPPMYHSGPQCDPYTHAHTHTHMQFTHDNVNVFRQHQTELLRQTGLYADTREHCATE